MNLDMIENTKKEKILMIAWQNFSRIWLPLYRVFSHSSEKNQRFVSGHIDEQKLQ